MTWKIVLASCRISTVRNDSSEYDWRWRIKKTCPKAELHSAVSLLIPRIAHALTLTGCDKRPEAATGSDTNSTVADRIQRSLLFGGHIPASLRYLWSGGAII
ncbi:hypothetical protein BJV78DRAFT_1230219 [Lactifluus subvellereus]|nr:hypothetical protein BJV78DRAFT_722418 [Lactifluus subvellereus]KAI0249081.1 hypothetical protein BJV78DRAFT_1230219 [Lactifluus subvellereus]